MSWNADEEDDTTPCPYCHRVIYEDAVSCPHCGNYLSEEDAPSGRSFWFIVCAVVCLVIALGWVWH
jgi:hypothetical protein